MYTQGKDGVSILDAVFLKTFKSLRRAEPNFVVSVEITRMSPHYSVRQDFQALQNVKSFPTFFVIVFYLATVSDTI